MQNQNELDQLWSDVKALLVNEMSSLPDLPTSSNKNQNNKFRKCQPFWNGNLDKAWRDVCQSESNYLLYKANRNGQAEQKKLLREQYKSCQNIFDSKFRYFKRQHRKQEYEDLEKSAQSNISDMWSKLKKLSNPPSTRAALEIVREDKSISHDIKEVLSRWHRDISQLFSGIRDNPEFAFDDKFYEEILSKKNEFETLAPEDQDQLSDYDSTCLNQNLTLSEVSKAIDLAKMRKAYLTIPNEALKN